MIDLETLQRVMGKMDDVDFVETKTCTTSGSLIGISGEVSMNAFETSGLFVRAFVDGFEGFASTENATEGGIEEAASRAKGLAKAGAFSSPQSFDAPITRKYDFRSSFKIDPSELEIEVKLGVLRSRWRELAGSLRQCGPPNLVYSDSTQSSVYANSFGGTFTTKKVLTSLYCNMFIEPSVIIDGGRYASGWEFILGSDMDRMAERVLGKASVLSEAKSCPSGRTEVVMSDEVSATLAHELGHVFEADRKSITDSLEGKSGVAGNGLNLTLTDDGSDATSVGFCPVDDEGVVASRVKLLDRGSVAGTLTNRHYASELGLPCTGNARAQDYSRKPEVRMRKTAFEEGDSTSDEILSGTKEGVLVETALGGQNMTNGELVIRCLTGRIVEKGKIGKAIRNFNLVGNPFDLLSHISAISRPIKIFGDFCGKDQIIPISCGGPCLRLRGMVQG